MTSVDVGRNIHTTREKEPGDNLQILQNVHVARQPARQHEASLRASAHAAPRGHQRGQVRHWLGRRLVRTGTWLTNERPMQPAQAG